jgi:protein TonB
VPHKTEVEGEVFEIFDVSQKALFPGGEDSLQQFIATHITYPPLAITSGTQGTVNVVFIVDNNGNVKDVAILGKPKGDGLDEAAINVIKLTSGMWTPAKIRDRSVNMRFRIPIAFRL